MSERNRLTAKGQGQRLVSYHRRLPERVRRTFGLNCPSSVLNVSPAAVAVVTSVTTQLGAIFITKTKRTFLCKICLATNCVRDVCRRSCFCCSCCCRCCYCGICCCCSCCGVVKFWRLCLIVAWFQSPDRRRKRQTIFRTIIFQLINRHTEDSFLHENRQNIPIVGI